LAEALADVKPPFAQPSDQVFKTAPALRTFKGGWYNRDGKRKYQPGDLDRAGIPFEDDRGRTIDRHALRTTFISWLGKYGVAPSPRSVMDAMHRHLAFTNHQPSRCGTTRTSTCLTYGPRFGSCPE
jgi:hypothetical protein